MIPVISGTDRRSKGFSLVEMLLVTAILIILTMVTLPAFNNMAAGMNISRSGLLLGDQLYLARQLALSQNVPVEVRFIHDSSGSNFTGVQVWKYDARGENPKPMRRTAEFPEGVILASSLSPLLSVDNGAQEGGTNFGSLGVRQYRSVRFRPNGRLESQPQLSQAFVTVQLERDKSDKPANFYTLQVNPLTGRLAVFRP